MRAAVRFATLGAFNTLHMYVFQPVPELQKIISEARLRSEDECYRLSITHEPRDA